MPSEPMENESRLTAGVKFTSGLTGPEAAALMQDVDGPGRNTTPVNRLPAHSEEVQGAIWTAEALAREQAALRKHFADPGLLLQSLPDSSPQRHLLHQASDWPWHLEGLAAPADSPAPSDDQNAAAGLALSNGPPGVMIDGFPTTLVEALDLASRGGAEVISVTARGSVRRTYTDIRRDAWSILGGLQRAGCKERGVVLVDMADARLAVPALFACLMGNLIPAPIMLPRPGDAQAAYRRMTDAIQLLAPLTILSCGQTAPLDPADPPLRMISDLIGHPDGRCSSAIDPSETALIVLTSGSSGIAKGVHQSHQSLLAMVRNFAIAANGLCTGDRMMNWMPLDHIGSLAFALISAVSVGIPLIQVDTAWILEQPGRWVDIASQEGATITWFPNFGFRLIAEHAPTAGALGCMRRLVSGGEAVQAADIAFFLDRLAPLGLQREGSVAPAFGMSETCSGITYSLNEKFKGSFACLGRPTPGSSLRIVGEQGEVLREGETGRLQVQGLQLFSGYHGQAASPITPDGWFDTGDLGFLEEGALYLTGRTKDIININGSKYFPQEIEDAARSVPGIDPNSLVALPYSPKGAASESLVMLFVPMVPQGLLSDVVVATLSEGIRSAVSKRCKLAVLYCLPCASQDLPRGSIGKINRTKLVAALSSGEFDQNIRRMERLERLAPTVSIGLHRLVTQRKPQSSGFPDHGGETLRLTFTAQGGVTASGDLPSPTLQSIVAVPPNGPEPYGSYAKLLEIAQALSGLPDEHGPSRVRITLEGYTACDAAPLAGLVRSLDLSQTRDWKLAPEVDAPRWMIERVTDLPPRLDSGGFWVVAGGLGGIGFLIASRYDAEGQPVLCIGRTPEELLPPHRISRLRQLNRGRYLEGDVRNPEMLTTAVSAGSAIFGKPLAGIILAAGAGGPLPLAEDTCRTYMELEKTLVGGFNSARSALREAPVAVLTVVGSVVGLLGGRSHSYAAAHAALLAAVQEAAAGGESISYVGFSSWSETGLSRGATSPALLARDGLQPLAAETGVLIVDAAQSQPGTIWFAGIDDTHPRTAPFCLGPSRPLVQPVAAIAGLEWPGAVHAVDATGRTVLIPARPSEGGADPRAAWQGKEASGEAPANAIERIIAGQFAKLLRTNSVERNADFFGLGGTSLTAMQLASALSRLFFTEAGMSLIFQNPTPRSLAAALIACEQEEGLTAAAAEQIEMMSMAHQINTETA